MNTNLKNIRLATNRLILREYRADDFEGVHAYASDLETVRFMLWGPNRPEDTRNFIQATLAQQQQEPRLDYQLTATLTTGEIIGGCGLYIRRPAHRAAEIGYVLNKNFWRQGYGTEIAQALLQLGFEHIGLHRISATCDPNNIGSARIMEKNHMRREGHFRDHLWQRGRWRDSLQYAILAHEWQAPA